jgi:2-oxoglutarate ferredoxin oxidoreductase subunit beta
VNSFYSIHGRVVPAAEGIKLARPSLKVIGFAGDGDAYGEGIEHLIFAAKRNIDITMIVHDNRVYGLTTGQYTPTSPLGFKGRSTPYGTKEMPLNPPEVMLSAGATYLARGTSHGIELLKKIFKDAISHKGFSLVDVLQVCVTYDNLCEYYEKRVYELTDHDPSNRQDALAKIREWDYNNDGRIPLGVLYRKHKRTFDESFAPAIPSDPASDRGDMIKEYLKRNNI